MPHPIPSGRHTITPHLIIKGASEAIEFYKKAFGAEELFRMPGPDGRIMHAELQIGDSRVMLSDEFPDMGVKGPQSLGGSPISLMLYLADVDAAFKRATDAGCEVRMPLANQFWGDRYGKVSDPFGHVWALGTHIEDVPAEEMPKRAQAAMADMGKNPGAKK